MKKASIKDVARLAGVSIATVSQILNNKGERFSEETRQKVFQARDNIGYVPNLSARRLKKQNSIVLGIVVRSLALPYFGNLVQQIQDHLPDNVTLSVMSGEGEQADQAVYQLMNSGVSAIIVGSQLTAPEKVAEDLKRHGVAMVVLENHAKLFEADSVHAKDFEGGRIAAQHLLALGHRHVVLLGNQRYTDNLIQRSQGFTETMMQAGGTVSEVKTHSLSKQSGQAAAMAVWITKATGVFALNDDLAIGLMAGLTKIGVHVPDDISVVGFDDGDYAAFYQPGLTTIHQPGDQIAQTALKLALARVADSQAERQVAQFDVHLTVRDSTKRREVS